MNDRQRELVRLASVLRQIHHKRYMSIRILQIGWPYVSFRRWFIDDADNCYDTMPPPLDATRWQRKDET